MMNVSEEELYNLPTAEYVNRRGGFVFKQHTVYHVAIHACAELRSKEVIFCLCISALPFSIIYFGCCTLAVHNQHNPNFVIVSTTSILFF
jgi:hypothetical protein